MVSQLSTFWSSRWLIKLMFSNKLSAFLDFKKITLMYYSKFSAVLDFKESGFHHRCGSGLS